MYSSAFSKDSYEISTQTKKKRYNRKKSSVNNGNRTESLKSCEDRFDTSEKVQTRKGRVCLVDVNY